MLLKTTIEKLEEAVIIKLNGKPQVIVFCGFGVIQFSDKVGVYKKNGDGVKVEIIENRYLSINIIADAKIKKRMKQIRENKNSSKHSQANRKHCQVTEEAMKGGIGKNV
jgi:hypothetical protein